MKRADQDNPAAFWLVLVLTTGTNATSNMLHVGNFSSKDHGQAAGQVALV